MSIVACNDVDAALGCTTKFTGDRQICRHSRPWARGRRRRRPRVRAARPRGAGRTVDGGYRVCWEMTIRSFKAGTSSTKVSQMIDLCRHTAHSATAHSCARPVPMRRTVESPNREGPAAPSAHITAPRRTSAAPAADLPREPWFCPGWRSPPASGPPTPRVARSQTQS